MSGPLDVLTKQVGPLPLGVWLLVGGGGLVIAYRSKDGGDVVRDVYEVPVPVGAIASDNDAPLILNPIIYLPDRTPAAAGAGSAAPVPATPVGDLPSMPTPVKPAAPVIPSIVLKPSGVVGPNVNPSPYPTTPPPNGARVVRDGSGREWVTAGSIPGITGWVWNRNTGKWQPR